MVNKKDLHLHLAVSYIAAHIILDDAMEVTPTGERVTNKYVKDFLLALNQAARCVYPHFVYFLELFSLGRAWFT